ncbi:hypothetical protein IFM89_026121 [Coptis chinensis]|uniref:KIB1-4 beta-propeller domain-containing protein n=1 Tax=Coptis chinensis TaxID=261450 RepID=A0A835IDA6_9MAGN|nr:hypothetical protein IFM89_026121 [Coptis chinensis]
MENATICFTLVHNTIYAIQPADHFQSSSSTTIPTCWIIKVEEPRPNVLHLLNPLARSKISSSPKTSLKGLNTLDMSFKISAPCKTYQLKEYLLFFRSGDKKWTVINDEKFEYHDLAHHNGHFYAVDSVGRTFIVDPITSNFTKISEHFQDGGYKKRFVESNGDLFLVDVFESASSPIEYMKAFSTLWKWFCDACPKSRDDGSEKPATPAWFDTLAPVGFKVFKLAVEKKLAWLQVENLGDRVFVVGDSYSFSISSSEFLSGCKGNCILYAGFCSMTEFSFIEYEQALKHDIVVFNLDDGSFAKLEKYPNYSHLFWPPPLWLTPTNPC